MPDGPMPRFRALVASGALRPDPAQRLAVEKLQLLHQRLRDHSPARPRRVARGWLGFGRKAARADSTLGGLYLYGGVGRGKSMLMDLFFDGAPVRRKRRVHFHAFMQEVHAGVHAARQSNMADPIPPVVDEIADSATLLCFDEFQVTDIADAMLLGRLFEGMFGRGLVVVATSNRHPDELYEHGLNRRLFLPFIALIKDRLDVHALDGVADHRRAAAPGAERWFAPLTPEAQAGFEAAWAALVGGTGERPLSLRVQGREIALPRAANGAARAGFDALCRRPLGAADYLALCDAVEAVAIERVPRLGRADANAAKRFVTLVDTLYEARRTLVTLAEAEPEALYVEGDGAFEFARCASRLHEMRGADWPPRA